jgi:hypothetical protein
MKNDQIWKMLINDAKVYINQCTFVLIITYTDLVLSKGRGAGDLKVCQNFSGILQWNDLNLTYVVIFARIFFIFRTICPNFYSYFNWFLFGGGGLPPLSYGYACMCTIIAISYTTRATSNLQLSAMPKLQGRLYELYFTQNMYSLGNRCA